MISSFSRTEGAGTCCKKECNIEKVQERAVLTELQRISTKFDLSVTLPA